MDKIIIDRREKTENKKRYYVTYDIYSIIDDEERYFCSHQEYADTNKISYFIKLVFEMYDNNYVHHVIRNISIVPRETSCS